MTLDRITLVVRGIVVVLAAFFVTFLAIPSPIHALAWDAPRSPNLEGPFAVNDVLLHADRMVPGELVGPANIAIDADGRLYAGTVDGKVVRTRADGSLEVFITTQGRPLGLAFAPDGALYIADAFLGLLRADSAGVVTQLTREIEGNAMQYPNQVTVAKDGTVYFTDSSMRWGYGEQHFDVLEQHTGGRLVRFDPRTNATTVLMRGLQFANGVALAADESHLLVAETGRYRIMRLWLTGPKMNTSDVMVENLPGFPAGISRTDRGTYWVALSTIRRTLLDRMHPYPFIKDCLASLPTPLRPTLRPYGMLFEMDANGLVLRSLHDATGKRFKDVSSAVERDGVVYFGTLSGTAIGRTATATVTGL